MKPFNNGFSLIEVLVFVTILSLFFVAAATVATVSLRSMKSNENKILATRYAEELVDWLSGEKETDWTNFIINKMGTWCFDSKTIDWSNNCAPKIDNLFDRLAILTPGSNPDTVNVNVTVSWNEANQTITVPIKTVFARFE